MREAKAEKKNGNYVRGRVGSHEHCSLRPGCIYIGTKGTDCLWLLLFFV